MPFGDLHPSATLSLNKRLSLTVYGDFFWRESTRHGIYGVAVNLLRTGRLSNARHIGSQSSAKFEYRLDRHTTIVWNYLHFFPGPFLRETPPGRDVNYATVWLVYRFSPTLSSCSLISTIANRPLTDRWCIQELTWAARIETTRHAAIDCFRYTAGSPLSP